MTPSPPPPPPPPSAGRWVPDPGPDPGVDLPAPGAAFAAEYRMLLRNVATTSRLLTVGGLALLTLLSAVLVTANVEGDHLEAAVGYLSGSIGLLTPVAILVFAAAVLGDLAEDGSLVYLWLRPIPSWVHVAAATAAVATLAVPLTLVPSVVGAAIIEPDGSVIGAALLGSVLAIVGYSALFTMVGLRFRRALPWGLLYILIWEGFIASAGASAARLAVSTYPMSAISKITGEELELATMSLGPAVVVPLLVAGAAIAYGSRLLARSDVA